LYYPILAANFITQSSANPKWAIQKVPTSQKTTLNGFINDYDFAYIKPSGREWLWTQAQKAAHWPTM